VVKYIVSACLAGFKSRYDGKDELCDKVRELIKSGEAVPFCPEQAGGLSTPRVPAEIAGGDGRAVLENYGAFMPDESENELEDTDKELPGFRARVLTKNGVEVTYQFVRGAQEMLKLARMVGATRAILKARSPSCGVGSIYDGTFSGNITKGDGVAAALLKASGIDVTTEDDPDNDNAFGND
jgi:uncharacterized protein YbbK (DUF523 family)